MAHEHDDVRQLDTNEVLEAYEKGEKDVVLLDVRENEEYNAGHIPNVMLIPTSEFTERFEKELDKEKKYIVVCRSGNRSHMVCKFLQAHGFEKERLANYDGGMLEWNGPTESGDLPTGDGERW